MDPKILLLLILTKKSLQDKHWNPYCDNKGSIETDEEFCCPKCTQETNKEKCSYECPVDYYRVGQRCNGISHNNIDNSIHFSSFACSRKCPKTHHAINLNATKICLSCSILCIDTSIQTSCSCKKSENETDINTILIITIVITASISLLAVTWLVIACFRRKQKRNNRRDKTNSRNSIENPIIQGNAESQDINDEIATDTEHKTEKDIAVAVQRQHEIKTRYVKDPTVVVRKKKEKEPERGIISDYANASTIRRNNIFNLHRISHAVSQFFLRKQEANYTTFEEDLIKECNTTSTQTTQTDELISLAFTGPVCDLNDAVSVEIVPTHVSVNQRNFNSVFKSTPIGKTVLQESKNTNFQFEKKDTTNAKSKTGNVTKHIIDQLDMNTLACETQSTKKDIPQSSNPAHREHGNTANTDVTAESMKQRLSIDEQSTNEIYENLNFDNKMTNNLTESKYEGQNDHNIFVRINGNSVCKVDGDSEASTNSSTSTKSRKSGESDVSHASYKTAPSASPRISEVEIYENIPYLKEMGSDLKQHSKNNITEKNEINNDALISKHVDRKKLVANENRTRPESDVSLRSIHKQRLGLETQNSVVRGDMPLSITAKESIDMKKITSQTNISLNNSTVTFVINQSNEGNRNIKD